MRYLRNFLNGRIYINQVDTIAFYHIADFSKVEFIEDIEFRWTKTKEHSYITPINFNIYKYYRNIFECCFSFPKSPDTFYWIHLFDLLKTKKCNLMFKTDNYKLILYNIHNGESYQKYELFEKEQLELDIPYAVFEKRPSNELYKLQK